MPKKSKNVEFFDEYVQEVTNLFLEKIQNPNLQEWSKGWIEIGGSPKSAITDKAYKGSNSLLLSLVSMAREYSDNRWLTFKQAADLGGHVKKGEHAVTLVYWKKFDFSYKDNKEATEEEQNPEKNSEKDSETMSYMVPFPFRVFNVEQCEGLKIEKLATADTLEKNWADLPLADEILKNSGAKILERESSQAYYNPIKDFIVLPKRAQFFNAGEFYDTALHELGHWTGHESRLNRDIVNRFGTPEYAREELRAELASFMLSSTTKIPHNPDKNAAYLKSWIQALKKDPKELFRAAADAEKIRDYILDLNREKKKSAEINEKPLLLEDLRAKKDRELAKSFLSLSKENQNLISQKIVNGLTEAKAVFLTDREFLQPPRLDRKVELAVARGMER